MASPSTSNTVAVIGLGALGLVTVKNLLEEGFDVTGFEKNPYMGGLWKYTEDAQTSALQSTIANITKQRGCFTDFPFPDDTPLYPTAADVERYLADYAKHFGLMSHLKLETTVTNVRRNEPNRKWMLTVKDTSGGETVQSFDKVVVANGTNNKPNIPTLEGQDGFAGKILHSRDFKRPEAFKNQRVMVVGLGNTAADVATVLVGTAAKVYLSHRQGSIMLPRIFPDGTVLDHTMTYRKTMIQLQMAKWAPGLAEKVSNAFVKGLQDKVFRIRDEWKLSPAPSIAHHIPTISDNLVEELEKGHIDSTVGPSKVTGPSNVELEDGEQIEVDSIIWCTGYKVDFSLVGEFDPTLHSDAHYNVVHDGGRTEKHPLSIPRLYRNIFSLQHPDSLAFAGTAAHPAPIFQTFDLASMAMAQVWKNPGALLPSKDEMMKSVQRHLNWAQSIADRGPFNPRLVNAPEWVEWAEDTAGVRVSEQLGYGIQGWRFWLRDPQLCKMLLDGILSPHIYRLFESDRRKAWSGAREAIEKANEQAKERLDQIRAQKHEALKD
ncbi:Monooxygenase aurF [Exophiala dermatitidis]